MFALYDRKRQLVALTTDHVLVAAMMSALDCSSLRRFEDESVVADADGFHDEHPAAQASRLREELSHKGADVVALSRHA